MLQNRLRFYLLVLHLAAATVLGYFLWGQPWMLAVELGFLVSIFIGWRLVEALFVPLRLVETGTDLISERDFTTKFVPVGQPEMDRLIEVYNSMIEALRDERLRGREQEEFLDRLIEASPAGVLICDLEGGVTQLNPAARRLLGTHSDKTAFDQLPSPWKKAVGDLDEGESVTVSLADGQRVRCRAAAFRDRGFKRRFLIFEELSEELRRSEKAAYEKLIRMMSHEVNNSAGAVTSLLGAFAHYSPQLEDEDRRDFESAIEIGAGRLERLTSFVDGFAEVVRLPPPNLSQLDLHLLVDELLVLYRPTLAERKIEFTRIREGKALELQADQQQIEQVILNVLKNAAEAIGDGTIGGGSIGGGTIGGTIGGGTIGGTIGVETRLKENRPYLEIRDDGPGIDASVASELFTPFFTTKLEGRGLGLTLVQEILSQHGAAFALESLEPPARGCRFSIHFASGDLSSSLE